LREVGKWLSKNGTAVYGTSASPFPDQPWGVATTKPGHLYLHVLQRPRNNIIYVPRFEGQLRRVTLLGSSARLMGRKRGDTLFVRLPARPADSYDTVVDVQYAGTLKDSWADVPAVVSRQFDSISIEAANARVANAAKIESKTHSRYFGNWKHDTVVTGQQSPDDTTTFNTWFLEPGDYRMVLEYAAPAESKNREGVVEVNGNSYRFQTLFTLTYDSHQPIMFVRHTIGVVSIDKPGEAPVTIHPLDKGTPLFWLRRVVFEPLR
jgi:alpha-L-fucosidase